MWRAHACARACVCHMSHLALSPQASLLEPRPDALYPPSVLRVAAVVSARALVLQHLRVVHQACKHNTSTTSIHVQLICWCLAVGFFFFFKPPTTVSCLFKSSTFCKTQRFLSNDDIRCKTHSEFRASWGVLKRTLLKTDPLWCHGGHWHHAQLGVGSTLCERLIFGPLANMWKVRQIRIKFFASSTFLLEAVNTGLKIWWILDLSLAFADNQTYEAAALKVWEKMFWNNAGPIKHLLKLVLFLNGPTIERKKRELKKKCCLCEQI